MKPRVEIVILKYKDPEVEVPCIESIINNTDWPYKLNVYDTRWEDANMSRMWNERIREATCDYILIIDSDTTVTSGWLDKMMAVYDIFDNVGAVVPRTDNCGNSPQTLPGSGIMMLSMGSGFCFLFKKDVIDKVGYFDEDFYVYGQDSEWFRRIVNAGLGIYLADTFVHHIGNYSTKKAAAAGEFDWEKEKNTAGDLFRKKTQ